MPAKFRGPSFEQAGFEIGGNIRAPFKVMVDQQFTQKNRKKLQELRNYNEITVADHVDFSKIDATLAAAKKFCPLYEDLWEFYEDLSRTDRSMQRFFPSDLQRSDGTYLNDGPRGITKFHIDMMKVQELRKIHDDDRQVLNEYFHKGSASWNSAKIDAHIAHYREQMRQSGKKRIAPTPNPRLPNKSPDGKKKRSA